MLLTKIHIDCDSLLSEVARFLLQEATGRSIRSVSRPDYFNTSGLLSAVARLVCEWSRPVAHLAYEDGALKL